MKSVSVEMTAQPRSGDFAIHHFANPNLRISRSVVVHVITAMALNGAAVERPNHAAAIDALQPVGDHVRESITLPSAKAERLVSLYASLTPQHRLQCHDLVTAVEGWDEDIALNGTFKLVQPETHVTDPEDTIVDGSVYNVHVLPTAHATSGFVRTHSAYGTSDNRLLGIVGEGLMLATMQPSDALGLYREGAPLAFLSRALSFK
jgi:hypothetical protein